MILKGKSWDKVLALEYDMLQGSQHRLLGTTEFSNQQADQCSRVWVSSNSLQV